MSVPYRQKSLNKIQQADRLDEYTKVGRSSTWLLVLAALLLCVAIGACIGFVGSNGETLGEMLGWDGTKLFDFAGLDFDFFSGGAQ